MISLKSSTRLLGLRMEMLLAVVVAEGVWMKHGADELVVTSCIDGTHSVGSRHYSGLAVDLRTFNLPGSYRGKAAEDASRELRERLGQDYDVVLEKTHVHVEFHPKRPY